MQRELENGKKKTKKVVAEKTEDVLKRNHPRSHDGYRSDLEQFSVQPHQMSEWSNKHHQNMNYQKEVRLRKIRINLNMLIKV